MTKLHDLAGLGQSIWLDYISKALVESGELQRWLDAGLRGMTSNPTIFEKAINGSHDYDAEIAALAAEGKSAQEIYETLAIADIRRAADLLLPIYQQTHALDGYISLEVSPLLARDSSATLAEARRLWAEVGRPNLMIKIPATRQGLPAIRSALAEGININVTLIFSQERYAEVVEAYLSGLEDRLARDLPVDRIASVASFFVSRVDSKVDKRIEVLLRSENPPAASAALAGKAAVANARLAYRQFLGAFSTERFASLQARGARVQRPLWASTSTKNPAYSDILYVQELIGPSTINTVPQETLEAFIDHGQVVTTIENGLPAAEQALDSLAGLGIPIAQVTAELEEEGVAAFAKSFETLLNAIETKRRAADGAPIQFNLGVYQPRLDAALQELTAQNILQRIWKVDHTVWSDSPAEITNRLGWLHSINDLAPQLGRIEALVYAAQAAGYTQVVVLGMGGSSLAPELFGRLFAGGLAESELTILDSTHPAAIQALAARLDPQRCLFIVSTKSGTTEETLSFFHYFYNWLIERVGADQTPDRFIVITDPASPLVETARSLKLRAVFTNDPDIGGRYSALSYFGVIPAAFAGVDLPRLLGRAGEMAQRCGPGFPAGQNLAAVLGAILGELALAGRDKLTLVVSPRLASLGDWIEQLIAESTGKNGAGILPVVGEAPAAPQDYGSDRLFVHLRLQDEPAMDEYWRSIEQAGHPVVRLALRDAYDIGAQFFLWELATAVAGQRLKIQPFDQPNVESTKKLAREMTRAYRLNGELPHELPDLEAAGINVYGARGIATPLAALQTLLAAARPGDYLCLQAFLDPNPETAAALAELRHALGATTRLATTLGFGPRFLHSTGQLHKGDAGNGLFVQFFSRPEADLPIPEKPGKTASSLTFGVLIQAQAMGDAQALRNAGRRLLRFELKGDAPAAIRRLAAGLMP